MEYLSVHETVIHYRLIVGFFNFHTLIWGCIGWGAALFMYYKHVKTTGSRWI